MAVVPASTLTDERAATRVSYAGPVDYRLAGASETGRGEWQSVGLGGGAVRLGRYLRPGRRVALDVNGHEVDAQIVWSRPEDRAGSFVSGLQFSDNAPETLLLTLGAVRGNIERQAAPNIG